MSMLIYATGNPDKFRQAQHACHGADFELTQERLEVPEIQSNDSVAIARDKAAKAYAKFKRPVVTSDDSWMIPGLNGFPGPYMKYMNDWLRVEDWLSLTRELQDRRIILRQIVVYQDSSQTRVFSCDLEGVLLTDPAGTSNHPSTCITSFDGGKHSTAEFHERNESSTAHLPNVWYEFAAWYGQEHDKSR